MTVANKLCLVTDDLVEDAKQFFKMAVGVVKYVVVRRKRS